MSTASQLVALLHPIAGTQACIVECETSQAKERPEKALLIMTDFIRSAEDVRLGILWLRL